MQRGGAAWQETAATKQVRDVTRRTWLILAAALTVGTAIGYVDSRPTWDDTGITAGCVFLTSALLAATRPRVAWLVGLAVGTPVLAFDILLHGNVGSAIAIAIALVGAGIGYVIGKTLAPSRGA